MEPFDTAETAKKLCSFCLSVFGFLLEYESQDENHVMESKYHCNWCDQSFLDDWLLYKHVRRKHNPKLNKPKMIVPGPGMPVLSEERFANTEDSELVENSQLEYRSLQSSQLVGSGGEETDESQPFQCPLCQKTYTWKGNLKQHMITHTGVRPFQCDQCHKGFFRKHDLMKHGIAVHATETPFACGVCNKGFHSEKLRLKHEQKIHYGGQFHECGSCAELFTNQEHLEKHNQDVHAKEAAHQCDDEKRLKRDMLLHAVANNKAQPI